jgi:hypothetical protein
MHFVAREADIRLGHRSQCQACRSNHEVVDRDLHISTLIGEIPIEIRTNVEDRIHSTSYPKVEMRNLLLRFGHSTRDRLAHGAQTHDLNTVRSLTRGRSRIHFARPRSGLDRLRYPVGGSQHILLENSTTRTASGEAREVHIPIHGSTSRQRR